MIATSSRAPIEMPPTIEADAPIADVDEGQGGQAERETLTSTPAAIASFTAVTKAASAVATVVICCPLCF